MTERYHILRPLGEGGMGRVVLAEDRESGRQVALKFLAKPLDPAARALFKQEAALLSQLSHPNLVRIFDYGETPEPFFAMESVDGLQLADAVKEADDRKILDLFVQTCRGLHYIHARSLLHRDLKPSNILVGRDTALAPGPTSVSPGLESFPTEGNLPPVTVKLLDFGIGSVGTPAYTAPEARGGGYDKRSEFYSLGALWSEVLRGRKIPAFFSEVLKKLTAADPNERPASAVALIKYLNRHVAEPFEISPEEEENAVLDKPPWVERDEEKDFWKADTSIVVVTGPMGVGRTRFLEELRWKAQLRGTPFLTFPDLHEETSGRLSEIQLELRRLARAPSRRSIVLEYDEDLVSPELQTFLNTVSSWKAASTIVLKDLNEAQTRRLIRGAVLDRTLDKKEEDAIVRASGGRPLLVLEYLRHRGESVPSDFRQAARAKAERLSDAARRLLTLVVAHPEPPEADWIESMAMESSDIAQARIELQAAGILEPPASADGRWRLQHPSLKTAYREAFSKSLTEAHQKWKTALLAQAPQDTPSRVAVWIVEHALDSADGAIARAWSLRALEYLSQAGQWAHLSKLCERLLPLAETPMDHAIVHAHRAAVHYRLGRYEDALSDYDAWYAHKPDDGTQVETIKHRLLTGRTLLAAGRTVEAKERLNTGLAAGDSGRHAHHRPFHAQIHITLAELETATDHLRQALALAAGNELLLGEIERRLGDQEQQDGHGDRALNHFLQAARHYRTAGNPQAEALARNSTASVLRWRGFLEKSLSEIETALRLAEAGGEVLQVARYRENRALILMDLGRYGEAVSDREKARDALEAFGTELDRSLLTHHDDELDAFLGRTDAAVFQALMKERRDRFPMPRLETLEATIAHIRALESPELRADRFARLGDDAGAAGLDRIALSLKNAAFLELEKIRHNLPEELKMDFEKRPDLKKLNETLGDLTPKVAAPSSSAGKGSIPAARFRQFCAINRQMALKTDMGEILDRVIDAAVEITGAERGFVLLKDGKPSKSPIPGFDVKVARNLNRDVLKADDFELSLSLVKQAIDKAAYVLTDDALSDPRFQEKKSVMDYRLRSALVVPLEDEGKVFGVIYLDHRYQPDCFSEEDLTLVNALAAQASLALQKARLIEELTKSRDKLAVEVREQAEKLEEMSEELTKKRGDLRYGYEEIIGQSPAMLKVFQVLDDVSETSIPVWIHGESGTGKELVARSLHVNSPRAKGPFVAENVSAIPETLLESELFGHKKGSFTHADRDRVGLFEQASGGTLFLDEVADMSLAMQAKLLRVLQEGEVRPVGAAKKVKIDVRLVTASNKDLERMVAEGKFRQDLFFRINGLTINLPSLRNRKEDIPLLVRYFSKKIAKEFNLAEAEVTDRAFKSLMAHNWPGNIRELEAVLRNALLFAKGKPIGPDHLTIKTSSTTERGYPAEPGVRGSSQSAGNAEGESKEDAAHRKLVIATLRKHELNKEFAAKELGVSLRTLYTWMEKHGLPKKKALLAQHVEETP